MTIPVTLHHAKRAMSLPGLARGVQYPMPMLTIITLTILIEIALGCMLRIQSAPAPKRQSRAPLGAARSYRC